jgi:exodeoxyribonuclease VIII
MLSSLAPGLYPNVPFDAYLARELGMVSKSALDLVHRSLAHYKAYIDGAEEESTPAFAFGSAFHCALLEPDRFAAAYAVEPDFGDLRTKIGKAARDEWRAEHVGALPLSDYDARMIAGMVGAVRSHPLAGKMIRDGEAEVTVRWKDAETGLQCKSRADYYVSRLGMVLDVKSTQNASEREFKRDVAKYRYFVQDALYRAGFAAVGAPIKHFVFVAVEKSPPFGVATFSLNMDGVAMGNEQARRGMTALANAMQSNEWPGYPVGIQQLDVPPWAA